MILTSKNLLIKHLLKYCCWISLETGFLCLRLEYWEIDCRLRYGGGA